ncbi:aldehyde dehydrogenase family protein [Halorussus marinus]|uniref:aldehyde dehydrogenase family protein n=1 Tax=Halorussus marinus TaxID=2505976 RepID=UPI001ADC97B7|nr:aldehyde dehydrogenase family protein [Halorussus marinus]
MESVKADLGKSHALRTDGERVETEDRFEVTSPGDFDLKIGEFAAGGEAEVDAAVTAAAEAFPEWEHRDITARTDIFQDAAERMRERKFELAATISLENGKNRTEVTADVDEAIDFLRFYSRELERLDGYRSDTGQPTPDQHTTNLLRPYGVFGVVAPFKFPLAILAGMLIGNTVVAKPASATPLIAHKYADILADAGLPDGVFNLVTGGGSAVGQPLTEHEDIAGVAVHGVARSRPRYRAVVPRAG